MLQQEHITKIALLIAITGITAVLILTQHTEANQIKIKDINKNMEGQTVKINAKILTVKQARQILILKIYDGTGKIDAVRFGQTQSQSLQKNSFASFEGKIKTYKGKLQIVIEKVRKWS